MKSSSALALALLGAMLGPHFVHAQQEPEEQPPQPAQEPTYTFPKSEPETMPPPEGSSLNLSEGATAGEELGEVPPEKPSVAGPFSQGRVGLHLALGTTFFGSRAYLMLGAGIGVHVVDGLELSLDGQVWLFDDPFAGTITPALTYTFFFVPGFTPYVGTFFRHYMLGDDIDDFDSIGFRVGGYLAPYRSRVRFGIGFAYERTLDCDDRVWECDSFYPELNFAIWF